jgi:cytochrome P450
VLTFALWKSPFSFLERCRHRYGSRFTINATSRPPLVVLSGLEDMKAMLAAPADVLHPGEGTNLLEPVVGEESFMLRDEGEHLNGRKAILPPLHAKAVRQHAELVAELAQREIASWPRGIPFALHPRLRALTLQSVLRITFGVPAHINDRRLDALRDGLLAMLSVAGSAVLPEPLLRHGPGQRIWRRFLRQRAETDELIYEIIRERGGCENSAESLFDELLNARNTDGSSMSAEQVRDNLVSLILAGHETTASQLAWAFQLLAHNPAVLDELIEEIDADSGEVYLNATIQEVLRHRPVFLYAIPREVKQPIEIGGWTYLAPAQLVGCIYLLHHDPTLYPDPHKFRPERFLQAPSATHTWLPWGGGRRRCPGLHLATLEMKTVLRTVLATTTVRPAAEGIEHPRWRSVIVTPHAGSRVTLEQRR